MLKQVLAGALLVTLGAVGAVGAVAEPRDPGGIYEFDQPQLTDDLGDRSLAARPVTPVLLTEIVTWLSINFDLPAMHDHPRVEFAQPLEITRMRYKGVLPPKWDEDRIREPATFADYGRDVIAIYNDKTRTIFLPEGWTGAGPAELSVLVHEMVHHLQNLAGMKFECPAARERIAYLAQNDWLKRFGHDLETDFQIDMLSLLVKTSCMF